MDGDVGVFLPCYAGPRASDHLRRPVKHELFRDGARRRKRACRRLADDQWKILILAEVSVEERELLMAVCRIVGGIQIERDRGGHCPPCFLLVLDAGVDRRSASQHRRRSKFSKRLLSSVAMPMLHPGSSIGDWGQLEDRSSVADNRDHCSLRIPQECEEPLT